MLSTIQNAIGRGKRPKPDRKDVKKSRKVQKAMKQHMETVALLDMK